jgi:hypothetical protein
MIWPRKHLISALNLGLQIPTWSIKHLFCKIFRIISWLDTKTLWSWCALRHWPYLHILIHPLWRISSSISIMILKLIGKFKALIIDILNQISVSPTPEYIRGLSVHHRLGWCRWSPILKFIFLRRLLFHILHDPLLTHLMLYLLRLLGTPLLGTWRLLLGLLRNYLLKLI